MQLIDRQVKVQTIECNCASDTITLLRGVHMKKADAPEDHLVGGEMMCPVHGKLEMKWTPICRLKTDS